MPWATIWNEIHRVKYNTILTFMLYDIFFEWWILDCCCCFYNQSSFLLHLIVQRWITSNKIYVYKYCTETETDNVAWSIITKNSRSEFWSACKHISMNISLYIFISTIKTSKLLKHKHDNAVSLTGYSLLGINQNRSI